MQWFRFYSTALDDPKVQRLTGDLFKAWVNLLCLANDAEERGTLPELSDIAFRLRLDEMKAEDIVRGLIRAGLLERDDDDRLCVVPFDIGQDGRNSAAYRNWRRDVLVRDGYCCQRCGDTSGPLHAHHIKSYADHPDLRFDESNGTTLCVFCHGVEHGRRIG